jgi:hypothetical protein
VSNFMKVGCVLEATTSRRRWRHKESGGRAMVMLSRAVHLPEAQARSLGGECDGRCETVRALFVGIGIGVDVEEALVAGIEIGVDCVEGIVVEDGSFVEGSVAETLRVVVACIGDVEVVGVGGGNSVVCGVNFGGVTERIGFVGGIGSLGGENDFGGDEPSIA